MNLRECDQSAADLCREYAENDDGEPQCAIVIRTFGKQGNVRVICPSINKATLANFLNKAADVLFDGNSVETKPAG